MIGTLLEKKYLIACISASPVGIILKSHTLHYTRIHYTQCKFGCDCSLMMRILLKEPRSFPSLSGLLLEWFSWKSIACTYPACATKEVRFHLYLVFPSRDMAGTAHFTLSIHAVGVQVTPLSVNYAEHSPWRTEYLSGCTTASIRRILQ
jgi:hypothetical protein